MELNNGLMALLTRLCERKRVLTRAVHWSSVTILPVANSALTHTFAWLIACSFFARTSINGPHCDQVRRKAIPQCTPSARALVQLTVHWMPNRRSEADRTSALFSAIFREALADHCQIRQNSSYLCLSLSNTLSTSCNAIAEQVAVKVSILCHRTLSMCVCVSCSIG